MFGDDFVDMFLGTFKNMKKDLAEYTVTETSIEVPSAEVKELLDKASKPGGELHLKTQLKKLYGIDDVEYGFVDETELTEAELKQIYADPEEANPLPSKLEVVRTYATVYIHTFDGKTAPVVLKPGSSIEIKTKDGYICAMVSMDEKPPTEDKVEAAPDGKRIVEV
jgi:copper chaperone CopZ